MVGSLPKYYDKKYFDARVVLPKYMCMSENMKSLIQYRTHFYMDFMGQSEYVGVLEAQYDGITYYFIDNEKMFGGFKPYSDDHIGEITKFVFFSKAALSILPVVGFRPDIVHCHDWQAAIIPVYLKERFAKGEFYQGMKTIMTIHNLKFQGIYDIRTVQHITGLDGSYFAPDKLGYFKDGNLLKGGLTYADAITTVSATYAEEIKTEFYGEKLNGLLTARTHDLRGIVNGIDYDEYNPDTDQYIVPHYNASHFR